MKTSFLAALFFGFFAQAAVITKKTVLTLSPFEEPPTECSETVVVKKPLSKSKIVKLIQEKIESLDGTGLAVEALIDLTDPNNPCVTFNQEIPELIIHRLKGELFLNPETLTLLNSLAAKVNSDELLLEFSDSGLKPMPKPRLPKPKVGLRLPTQAPPVCRAPTTMPIITDRMVVKMRMQGSNRRWPTRFCRCP